MSLFSLFYLSQDRGFVPFLSLLALKLGQPVEERLSPGGRRRDTHHTAQTLLAAILSRLFPPYLRTSEGFLPPTVGNGVQHSTDGCAAFTLLSSVLQNVGSGKEERCLSHLRK